MVAHQCVRVMLTDPERRALVEHVRQVECDHRTGDALALLDMCLGLARWDWRDGYALADLWSAAMAGLTLDPDDHEEPPAGTSGPGVLEALCRNVVSAAATGRGPARWTDGEHRPAEDVRRDLRRRRTCARPVLLVGRVTVTVEGKSKAVSVPVACPVGYQDAPVFVSWWKPNSGWRPTRIVCVGEKMKIDAVPHVVRYDEGRDHRERVARVRAEQAEVARKQRWAEDDRAKDREVRGARKALDNAIGRVAKAGKGDHNGIANTAAYALGGAVALGLLDEGEVVDALVAAGIASGRSQRDARHPVVEGMAKGKGKPWEVRR